MDIKTIACCTDFSDHAHTAFDHALDLAKRYNAKLSVIHVLPPAIHPLLTEVERLASEETELLTIKSPMVGSFYSASDPDSPPFVEVGSQVTPSTVVCILEAMKVFSEIKAEVSGTIEKILATNSQAVEYGQPLFLVRPD